MSKITKEVTMREEINAAVGLCHGAKEVTYRVSKLMPDEYIAHAVHLGHLEHIADRWTGRTLGVVMQLVGKALTSPNQAFPIPSEDGSHRGKRFMLQSVQDLLDKLGLEYFELRHVDYTIQYKPYKYVNAKGEEI